MNTALRSLLLLPLAALIACGSSAPAVGGIAPTSGDYFLSVAPVSGSAASSFSGNLYISGTSVSGSFLYNNGNSSCNGQSFPVTGTINSAGTLMSLNSSAFAGSLSGNTATLTLQLPLIAYTNNTYNTTGTAQIAAGTSGTNCALASSTLTAQYLQPYNGGYTGTLTSGTSTVTATIILAESIPQTLATSTSAAGLIPASGSLTFNGAACNFSQTLTNSLAGQISGYTLDLYQGTSSLTSPVIVSASETTSPITFNVLISSGTTSCPAGSYSGTINPQ
jgi:hypothetical protein